MTALDKLRSAFETQITRNVDLHEEFVYVGAKDDLGPLPSLEVKSERESWQEDEPDDEEVEYLTLFDVLCALDEIKELAARPPIDLEAHPIETDPGKRFMQILESWQDNKRKLAYYK